MGKAAFMVATAKGFSPECESSMFKVWKLYNTKTMDFHLFFCSRKAVELQVGNNPSLPAADPAFKVLESLLMIVNCAQGSLACKLLRSQSSYRLQCTGSEGSLLDMPLVNGRF